MAHNRKRHRGPERPKTPQRFNLRDYFPQRAASNGARPTAFDGNLVATKDLLTRFDKKRDATRKWAAYLFATTALLLAWSRSPSWRLKIPYFLIEDAAGHALTSPAGFAPIFGLIIVLLVYIQLYLLHEETLPVGQILSARLRHSSEKQTVVFPFYFGREKPLESTLFVLLVLLAPLTLTLFLFGDFLLLEHGGAVMWQSLYKPAVMWGIVPSHRQFSAEAYVYGGLQAWIYVLLTAIDGWIAWKIFCGVRQTLLNGANPVPTNGSDETHGNGSRIPRADEPARREILNPKD
jgi:hypothetical protein